MARRSSPIRRFYSAKRFAFRSLLPALAACCLILSPGTTQAQQQAAPASKISFNKDIRPILSDKCFFCHGPDAANRQADLRLDDRAVAVEQAAAIRPDQPDASPILERILSEDPDLQMPPPHSKLDPITPEELQKLRNWIAEGAVYEPHWSFLPPEFPTEKGTPASLIDEPIRRKLATMGRSQRPSADRATLLRRLSLDLIGLPPTPEELTEFLEDPSPDAYAKQVDRLLNSPRYAERMAVDWLDVARYSDSFGFQVDRDREMWRWRDWVLQAFEKNMPFDQFIQWQVAGDMIENPTQDSILATAFQRLHQQEAEGGSVEEEYRVEYVTDRVQTFATAFLGLTFECARCHDHKFDPISQKDFYRLFAVFQNIDEAGLYSYFTPSPPTPALMLPNDPQKEQLATLRQSVEEAEQAVQKLLQQRMAGIGAAAMAQPLLGEIARFPLDELQQGKSPSKLKAEMVAEVRGENKAVAGQQGQAVELTGDDPIDLPIGNFRRSQPFSISLWAETPDRKERAVVLHRSRAWTDAASRGYELLLEEGRWKWSLIHFWPGNAISIRTRMEAPLNQWTHVTATYDGSSRAAGLKLYIDGKPVDCEVVRDNLTKEITGGGGDNIAIGERFRDRGFRGGKVDELRVFDRQLTAWEVAQLPSNCDAQLHAVALESLGPVDAQLQETAIHTGDETFRTALVALQQKREALHQLEDSIQEIMVMRELPGMKPAYLLTRGEYNQRGEAVEPGVPEALPPLPEGTPANRLSVARWLTAPNHPLTARVLVNRLWQSFFGRGLVKTSEDFGSQGDRPRYQEVLDGLSAHWIQTGWDLKGLIRTIVMSDTYRQESLDEPKWMEEDPENDWLARGPRFRLSAEAIRDQALAVSGLLKHQLGGPPVTPYEMSEAFKPAGPSGGDDVRRRSLYSVWRRTSPPPAMLAFDAPRRAVCIAKRERTNTPLQSLILLNGTQYVEAARALGERLHQESQGELPKMIERGYLLCLSRKPTEPESKTLQNLYEDQLAYYQSHPEEAAQIRKVGNASTDPMIDDARAAAAFALGQALMNLDAFLMKR